MRTEIVEEEIYSYEDLLLPEYSWVKDNVIKQQREKVDCYYIWSEAKSTIDAFLNAVNIPIRTSNRSWMDFNIERVDNNILELSGLRLRTWLINNFTFLWKPKWKGSLKANEYIKHNRIKSPKEVNSLGNRYNPYYSGCQVDNCCVLTGMCYDDDFLKPIYDFIRKPNDSNLESILNDCSLSLSKTVEDEQDYRYSDEGIMQDISDQGLEIDEFGNEY